MLPPTASSAASVTTASANTPHNPFRRLILSASDDASHAVKGPATPHLPAKVDHSGPSTLCDGGERSEDHLVTIDVTRVADAVLAAVRETVAEVNPTCHAAVTLDSSLDRDLGLDSLVRAELLVRVEELLNIRLSETLFVDAQTPRDLVDAALRAENLAPLPVAMQELHPEASAALPRHVRTLVEALEWHASEHPERVHVQLLGEDARATPELLTYAALRNRGRAVAAGLAHSDVRPGETVAIMLATSLDYFAAFVGILMAGAIPVPLYPPARPAQLDDYLRRQIGILDNAGAVALITSLDAERVARVLRRAARVASADHDRCGARARTIERRTRTDTG